MIEIPVPFPIVVMLILYCIVLYYIVMHCIALHHIVLYCIMLFYVVTLHYVSFRYVTLRYVTCFPEHRKIHKFSDSPEPAKSFLIYADIYNSQRCCIIMGRMIII